jgi:hypothetical protein
VIGHGSFIGTQVITLNAPVGSVTDSQLRTQLKKWTRVRAGDGVGDGDGDGVLVLDDGFRR